LQASAGAAEHEARSWAGKILATAIFLCKIAPQAKLTKENVPHARFF